MELTTLVQDGANVLDADARELHIAVENRFWDCSTLVDRNVVQ